MSGLYGFQRVCCAPSNCPSVAFSQPFGKLAILFIDPLSETPIRLSINWLPPTHHLFYFCPSFDRPHHLNSFSSNCLQTSVCFKPHVSLFIHQCICHALAFVTLLSHRITQSVDGYMAAFFLHLTLSLRVLPFALLFFCLLCPTFINPPLQRVEYLLVCSGVY